MGAGKDYGSRTVFKHRGAPKIHTQDNNGSPYPPLGSTPGIHNSIPHTNLKNRTDSRTRRDPAPRPRHPVPEPSGSRLRRKEEAAAPGPACCDPDPPPSRLPLSHARAESTSPVLYTASELPENEKCGDGEATSNLEDRRGRDCGPEPAHRGTGHRGGEPRRSTGHTIPQRPMTTAQPHCHRDLHRCCFAEDSNS